MNKKTFFNSPDLTNLSGVQLSELQTQLEDELLQHQDNLDYFELLDELTQAQAVEYVAINNALLGTERNLDLVNRTIESKKKTESDCLIQEKGRNTFALFFVC